MHIVVLHGEDISQSTLRLKEHIESAKAKGFEIVRVEPNSGKSLKEIFSSASLFEKSRLFIVEIPGGLSKKDFDWLSKETKNISESLVFFSKSELKKDFLNKLPPESKVEQFKLPENIYKFLDSFYPGNSKASLQILHKLMLAEPIEKILFFLATRVRDLYWVGKDAQGLPYKEDWRILKTLSQARKFEKERLESIIRELAQADISSKTSDTSTLGLLDQIIATQLE